SQMKAENGRVLPLFCCLGAKVSLLTKQEEVSCPFCCFCKICVNSSSPRMTLPSCAMNRLDHFSFHMRRYCLTQISQMKSGNGRILPWLCCPGAKVSLYKTKRSNPALSVVSVKSV